ncbi:major facilitator superfamily MFS_1 [Desulfitobacterium hafniense DCB-2]|uniref:Major facilitator super MFS 1 n=2 Tax=Desulfitobacterium hafniense TaxID=49338 RepID=A0A098B5P0_DESHA|nr:MFS transporter [Desulfitobacterium hafniense]ACL19939.1 major facilitator superfamily MFS_1 [Desulfitobacterium hafniense DCB-2]CDX03705.1 Major facilitator super MFS 1 [Desulfitobacterium hafniense]
MTGSDQSAPTYFDDMKLTSSHKRMLWLAAICYMFDQMDVGTFAYAAPVLVKTWGLTMEQIAQVNSYGFVGMFLGAIFGGWIADKIGRKKTIILCVAIFSLGSLGNALAFNFHTLAITRFFTGLGVIGMLVVAMVYIAEMMPSEHRGRYQALTMACGTIAIPVGAAFARWVVPLSTESWRYIFVLGGTSILLLPFCFIVFKESPRWLVSKGRITEAEKVIREITGREVDLSSEVPEKIKKSSSLSTLKLILSKEYLKRTIILVIITDGVVLGAQMLGGFYPAILQEYAGFQLTLVLSIMALSWWGIPFGDLSASLVSDKGGRKGPLALFSIINGMTFVVCGFFPTPAVIIAAVFLSRVFGGGSVSILYTYLAESYPTHIRSTAVGLIMGQVRILSAVIVLIVPPILATYGWLGVHLVNAGIIIVTAIVALIFGQKTSKRTLEEINKAPG